MNISSYGKNLFGELEVPCFITKLDSEKIVYANLPMESLLVNITKEPILGKKYYQVLANRDGNQSNSLKNRLENRESYEAYLYNVPLNLHFRCVFSPLQIQQEEYVLCKYYPIEQTSFRSDRFEEAMTRCVFGIHLSKDEMLPSLLETLCQFYQSDCGFVYRANRPKNTILLEGEYCREEGRKLTTELGEKINSNILLDWFEKQQDQGFFHLEGKDVDLLDESVSSKVLNTFQLRNLTLCAITNLQQETLGVVGVCNSKGKPLDTRLMHLMSRLVAQKVDKVAVEETLYYVNNIDSLTGFLNRNNYNKKMQELAHFAPKKMGVIFVNINGLKIVNQNMGCLQGDSHIKSAARTLRKHFPYPFYRISGDEFLGIALDVDKEELEEQVNLLHHKMKEEHNCVFSMGHAWAEGSVNFNRLVEEADTVMYINKQEYYYDSDRHFDHVGDSTLSDLLSYLENDEFMVYLQPQVNLKDGSLVAAEALIRRFDKTNQKMVFPDQFIPLYEMKSVIRHIDFFVLDTVCKLLAEWKAEGFQLHISVNLSRVTLLEHGIVESIVEICDKYQVEHSKLIIEVTERVGLIENDVASSLINQFKAEGFTISLDDFGCAYSNIITLAQIQVDEVKIDKSLVDHLVSDKKNHVLVKNILCMCNELENTSTLAEGIEDQAQADLLYELGCKLGQGYYFSRPIPIPEFYNKYFKNQEI